MPAFLGHCVDSFGFDVACASRIASAETLGMAIGQGVAALCAARAGVELWRIAAACLVALAIAQVASIWDGSALEFSAARRVSGVACPGLLFAILGIYLAGTPNPDRAYSLYHGAAFVVGPLGLYLLPLLLTSVGSAPVYATLVVLSLAGIARSPRSVHFSSLSRNGFSSECATTPFANLFLPEPMQQTLTGDPTCALPGRP